MRKLTWGNWVVGALTACGGNTTPEPEVAQTPVSETPSETDAAAAQATADDPPLAEPPRGKRTPCVLGQDQTCNGDPSVSALWGTCTEHGTCECKRGFVLAPTGYCQPQP